MAGWRSHFICLAVMLALFGWAFSAASFAHLRKQKVAPRAYRLMLASAYALPVFPAGFLLATIVRRRGERLVLRASLLGALALLGGVGTGAILIADEGIIFAEERLATATGPDGSQAALYGWGLFCGYTLYQAPEGRLFLDQVASSSMGCDELHRSHLEYADGGFVVVESPP